jgi:uncharacterized protein YabN with tetrapyrrole methylase and pyrophosphatase domain
MNHLQDLQNNIHKWSKKVFGTDLKRKEGLANHLKEEAAEVKAAVWANNRHDLKYQLADCLIIMLDLARLYDITADEIIIATKDKMITNYSRKWEGPDQHGMYHHKKE